jgi:hypothetical protein
MMHVVAVPSKHSSELLPMRYSTKRNLMYLHFTYSAHIAMSVYQKTNARNLIHIPLMAYFVASQINTRPIIYEYLLAISS